MSVIGSLAAFDHWRQRVYLIESVPTLGLDADELDAAYDAAVSRVAAGGQRPCAAAPVHPGRAAHSDDNLPTLSPRCATARISVP